MVLRTTDERALTSIRFKHVEVVLARAALPSVPRVVPPEHPMTYDAAAGFFVPDPDARREPKPVTLPPALYLRWAQVDVDDIDTQLELINLYGSPGVDRHAHGDYDAWADPKTKPFGMPEHEPTVVSARERTPEGEWGWIVRPESRESVRAGIETIRALVAARYRLDGRELPTPRLLGDPELEWVSFFGYQLDQGISQFAPRALSFRVGDGLAVDEPESDEELWIATIRPMLFSVLVLQFAHSLLEKWDVKACENDTCDIVFTRRLRADAKFCSAKCARQQAQREYMRRKRFAARGKPDR